MLDISQIISIMTILIVHVYHYEIHRWAMGPISKIMSLLKYKWIIEFYYLLASIMIAEETQIKMA